MLMEQEKYSDDMDPQEMGENLQLLRGRTLSRLVDEIFSPFRILSPTHLCPLSPRLGVSKASRDLNFHYIPKLAFLQQDDQSESAGEKRKR